MATKNPPKWHQVYPQGTTAGNEEYKFWIALARHPKFGWRSVGAIAKESGLTEKRTEEILQKYYSKGMVFPSPKNEENWGYWERVPEMLPKDAGSLATKDQKKRIDKLTGKTTNGNGSGSGKAKPAAYDDDDDVQTKVTYNTIKRAPVQGLTMKDMMLMKPKKTEEVFQRADVIKGITVEEYQRRQTAKGIEKGVKPQGWTLNEAIDMAERMGTKVWFGDKAVSPHEARASLAKGVVPAGPANAFRKLNPSLADMHFDREIACDD